MYEIDAAGRYMTPSGATYAMSRDGAANTKEVYMHPAQAMCWLNQAITVQVVNQAPADLEVPKKKHPHTFFGAPIVEDEKIPNDEIRLCDEQGNILVRIFNLAVPEVLSGKTHQG
jgi:hypothetical protein